jgi:hypothetical protein
MNDHDTEITRAVIENENVTSDDLGAKRFAPTIRPTPALQLPPARRRTRLRKTKC